jgi:hypothetical protein
MALDEEDCLEEEMRVAVLHGNPLVVALVDRELHKLGDNRVVGQVFHSYLAEGSSGHLVPHNDLLGLGETMAASGDNVEVEEGHDSDRADLHRNSAEVAVGTEQMIVEVRVVHHAFHAEEDMAPFPAVAGDTMGILRACSVSVVTDGGMGSKCSSSCSFETEKVLFAIF